MRKLVKPEIHAQDYFDLCISKTRENELKKRLKASSNEVGASCLEYETLAADRRTYDFVHGDDFSATERELFNVYDRGCRSGPGRGHYDEILLSSPGRTCTLCWRRDADTLDHYLPRSTFHELSVAPANLIPVCSKCNSTAGKGIHVPTSFENQLVHPYYDDYSIARWLWGVVSEVGGETTVRFDIDIPEGWDKAILDRLNFHFDKLGLWELYAANAASEMENIVDMINSANLQGVDDIRAFLLEMANKKSRRNPNSWETATYFALAEHDAFLEEMAEMTGE